jgi:site-specific DNA-methyltransferase (adenine-specific)
MNLQEWIGKDKPLSSFINCDCMELMATVPDKYFELCICDPPYGINININIGRRQGDKKSNYHKFHGEDRNIPNENYFNELFRISQNQIIWGGIILLNI